MHVASAQLVRLKELIAYKTRHGVVWLGREDQEVRLGFVSVKGKLEAQEQLIVEAVKHE